MNITIDKIDTRWLVVYDPKSLSIYLLERTTPVQGSADYADALEWAKAVTNIDGGLYSSVWVTVEVPNGQVPGIEYDFDDEDEYDLRAIIAIAQFGGPMPKPDAKRKFLAWRDAQLDRRDDMSITYVMAEDDGMEYEPSDWYQALADHFNICV